MKKYNLPCTKKEKAALLKSILRGEMKVNDLKEDGFYISMWQIDQTDPEYLISIIGSGERISRTAYAESCTRKNVVHVSLDLSK
jgi:hypothetical protein